MHQDHTLQAQLDAGNRLIRQLVEQIKAQNDAIIMVRCCILRVPRSPLWVAFPVMPRCPQRCRTACKQARDELHEMEEAVCRKRTEVVDYKAKLLAHTAAKREREAARKHCRKPEFIKETVRSVLGLQYMEAGCVNPGELILCRCGSAVTFMHITLMTLLLMAIAADGHGCGDAYNRIVL